MPAARNEIESYLRDATASQKKALATLDITTLAQLIEASAIFARSRTHTAHEVSTDRAGKITYIRHITGFLKERVHNAFIDKWRAISDGLVVEGGESPNGWWGIPVTGAADKHKPSPIVSASEAFVAIDLDFPALEAPAPKKNQMMPSAAHIETVLDEHTKAAESQELADIMAVVEKASKTARVLSENDAIVESAPPPSPVGYELSVKSRRGWSPFDSPIARPYA